MFTEPLDGVVKLVDLGGTLSTDRYGGGLSRPQRERLGAFVPWRACSAGERGAEDGHLLSHNGGWCLWSHDRGRREDRSQTVLLRG